MSRAEVQSLVGEHSLGIGILGKVHAGIVEDDESRQNGEIRRVGFEF